MRVFQGKQVREVLARNTKVVVAANKARRHLAIETKVSADGKPSGYFVVWIKNQKSYLSDGGFTPFREEAKPFTHRVQAQDCVRGLKPMGLDATVKSVADRY